MFVNLRKVNRQAQSINRTRSCLQTLGYQPFLSYPVIGMRYLRIHGQFDDQSKFTALLGLSMWANVNLPVLAGLDWTSVDERLLHPLLIEQPFELLLTNQHTELNFTGLPELVQLDAAGSELVSLETLDGTLLIEQFAPPKIDHQTMISTMQSLPIPLTFHLGCSFLSLGAVRSMEVGDVMLIAHPSGSINTFEKTIFLSQFQQESIMILPPQDQEFGELPDNEHDFAADCLSSDSEVGLDTLPIRLSVILMQKTVPLDELAQWAPGETIVIPDDAILNVEIRANQRLLARGELIQLENGQLGVEINQLWPQEKYHD